MSDQNMESETTEAEIPADCLDDGPDVAGKRSKKQKTDPMRKCLVSGERKLKSEMIRFVLGPDQTLVPDLKAVLPGRGMWASASSELLGQAAKRGLFAKAARSKVIIPDDFVAQLEKLLVRRCSENLSLANRAGQAIVGFEKVRSALKAEARPAAGLVLAARDGADDGKRKVGQLAAALKTPVSDVLDAEEIGIAFGRDMVIHAYLLPGGLTDSLKADTARLAGFRKEAGIKEEG
ncbi:RNA-binding protein [Curvivirga sp.]|uniref:RNA-binding protein n=1 Tax=Curvivirga sp. TaxID=2856848 RepID=UPI003B5BE19D